MNTKLKDPGSAITHLIAMIGAVICSFPLIYKAVRSSDATAVAAMTIFICSMILLYGASTLYHSLDISTKINLVFRRIDHAMIFVLIAGSYTPVCLLALDRSRGIPLLIFIWVAAAIGILLKIFIINCPHWVSSVIYIAMGWTCVFVFKPLLSVLPAAAFGWLFAGGIIYTIGGILYGLKLPIFQKLPANFGSHEIFHLFVMGGSFCHFIFMYVYML
ncbi:MAG: hemolysin III family protein [Lachnospiraceae bacterium]|nr:hemolysin III family protein [Lachnospiraceae bacterium]